MPPAGPAVPPTPWPLAQPRHRAPRRPSAWRTLKRASVRPRGPTGVEPFRRRPGTSETALHPPVTAPREGGRRVLGLHALPRSRGLGPAARIALARSARRTPRRAPSPEQQGRGADEGREPRAAGGGARGTGETASRAPVGQRRVQPAGPQGGLGPCSPLKAPAGRGGRGVLFIREDKGEGSRGRAAGPSLCPAPGLAAPTGDR